MRVWSGFVLYANEPGLGWLVVNHRYQCGKDCLGALHKNKLGIDIFSVKVI